MHNTIETMTNVFINELSKVIEASLDNDFNDNFDFCRFPVETKIVNREEAYKFLFKNFSNFAVLHNSFQNFESKELFIKLIAFRLLGHKKVKLPLSNDEYKDLTLKLELLGNSNDVIDGGLHGNKLRFMDLQPLNIPLKMYGSSVGLLTNFILKQYQYTTSTGIQIGAQPGNYVIDGGACWGDTALYLANLVGSSGKVYSFEFTPGNVGIFNKNINLNPALKSLIELIQHPLWESTGESLTFEDGGPGSYIKQNYEVDKNNSVHSYSIDGFVNSFKVPRIDFIKMDIEGSELRALKGSTETLMEFKPQLAITIYHNFEDYIAIPEYIASLNLGYKFYLNHFTMHHEETVLFASV